MGVFNKTIKVEAGLASIGRNNKATPRFTAPVRATQSSARGLSQRAVKLQCALTDRHFQPASNGLTGSRPKPIRIHVRRVGEGRPFLAWILT